MDDGRGSKLANVTGTSDTTSKLTFLFPQTSTNMTIRLRVRSADDPGGTTCAPATCDTVTIDLVPLPDLLQNIVAKNDGKGRWVVNGTSTVLISNNVRVHAGGINGPVIGTALVDPTGAWKIDVRNSTVPVNPSRTVTAESDRGGVALHSGVRRLADHALGAERLGADDGVVVAGERGGPAGPSGGDAVQGSGHRGRARARPRTIAPQDRLTVLSRGKVPRRSYDHLRIATSSGAWQRPAADVSARRRVPNGKESQT